MNPGRCLPPEILEFVAHHLVHQESAQNAIKSLCKFRLISKACASIGFGYLFTTIRLRRLPTSFDKAEAIVNHPRARSCVKKLICYGDSISTKSLPAKDKKNRRERVEDCGEDLSRIRSLVEKLPCLTTIQYENVKCKLFARTSGFVYRVKKALRRARCLDYEYQGFVDGRTLIWISTAPQVNQLIVSHVSGHTVDNFPAYYWQSLTRLAISITFEAPPSWIPLVWLNTLETLELRSSTGYTPVSFELPQRLKYLGLSGFELQGNKLPDTLEEIYLANMFLWNTDMLDWAELFLTSLCNCRWFIVGHLLAEPSDNQWCYEVRTPLDRLMGTSLGEVMKQISSVPRSFSDEFRGALLREIFGSSNDRKQEFRYKPGDLVISNELAEKYALKHHPPNGETYPKWAYLADFIDDIGCRC